VNPGQARIIPGHLVRYLRKGVKREFGASLVIREVLCSGALYLVSVGTVMILAYFAARLVALWTIGPVN
jgi:hypothetical protein